MPLHSRGGSTAEWKFKKEEERIQTKEKGSILTRVGILEAVFEQGEECSARGRISAREVKRTTAQEMKGLEKQCVRCAGWAPACHTEPLKVDWGKWVFTTNNVYVWRRAFSKFLFMWSFSWKHKAQYTNRHFLPFLQIQIAGNHSVQPSVTSTRPDGSSLAQPVMLPLGLLHCSATWCNGYDRPYCKIIKAGQE